MEQRTPEWTIARLGKVTASRVADMMAKTKSGYSASRKNYMAELICERLTGVPTEHYENVAMKRGTETEPLARSAYEARKSTLVEEVGFIDHPYIPMFGASPDGLVGGEGGLEIKCPNTATHIELLIGGGIDQRYIYQMQVAMMCTGRKWWDFVDYDPRLPENLQLFIQRVFFSPEMAEEIELEVTKFNAEIDETISKLEKISKEAKY